MTDFLSGFISIIGSPNVGKSTLMNRLVGQKVSIVSARAQTTRNRIMGVVTRDAYQIVFLDTPGVTTPKNKLGEYMLKVAWEAMDQVEAVLLVIDGGRGIGEKDESLIETLGRAKAPIVCAVNKTDVASPVSVEQCRAKLADAGFNEIFTVSAANGDGVAELEAALSKKLVAGPKYFPDDMVTDMPERLVCCELIREKALNLLREEVPHGIGVGIDKMEAREDGITDIWATLYCERNGHKGIIIGKNGSMLKRIGTDARLEMEWLLGTRVNLQLWVKVKEDWRNKQGVLHELGYE